MPANHHNSDQETSKQDPTERRRLQNRLSQRNHRRKIRDRIAKLQERVIASELRAAATLHGWHSAPCIPYEVKPSPSSTSSSLSLPHSVSSSPPTELQCPALAPACSSYNITMNPITPLSVLPASGFDDGNTTVGSLGGGNGSGTPSPTTLVAPDSLGVAGSALLLPGQGLGLDTMQLCEQWGFQGSVYLATESSLPQILQTLGPTSNAIIVVPTPGYPMGHGGSGGGLEYTSAQSQGMDLSGCQCQSLVWMSCPVHSMDRFVQ